MPYQLLQGWEWVRFGNIAQHNSGKTLDKGRNTGKLRDYITTSNLYWGYFELENIRQMPIRDDELEKCTAKKGDLLICEGGEAGRASVWFYDNEVCFQNHIHRARFYRHVDPYFVYRFFEKLNATGEINQHRKGVGISNMSSKALASIVFPFPPLPEQRRIVGRIDQLMARCDELERLRGEREQKRRIVHITALKRLLDAVSSSPRRSGGSGYADEAFTNTWQFITRHFSELYSVKENVTELRRAILQLAVMGRLVPQDPNDPPASELLKAIEAEKQQLVKEGKIKVAKPLPAIKLEEVLYELPEGWEWVRFFTVNTVKSELVLAKEYPFEKQIAPDSIEKGSGRILFHRTVEESGATGPNNRFYEGQILYSKIRPSLNKAVIAPYSGLCSADMYPIVSHVNVEFMLKVILSETFLEQVRQAENRVKMPKLNLESLGLFLIPLPPLSEQQCIVAKVDQLMALCDTLESQIDAASNKQAALLNALMAQV
ncbi:restriction endonuclease subunit S [Nitrosomonas communis]|uniref:Type I restriction enzyme, S subunit n=1 Tax=Nitrosomonas communis TaxID=44574 RepID=A0A1H2RP30_9PROT|nr:restriction endonuclease subunit S [Nitrosomonas communis]SDW21127.1 type I restriction enzyme, S subunit [Nitrosomonas communis]